MLNTPFSPWPSFTEEEAEAVRSVVLSNRVNYWTGDQCRSFEAEFAAWCACAHAVAVANGTVALELALRALEIGPGDEVIVTPRTFIASASCIVSLGATPVFADVERDSQNISAATIEAVLTPRTKAVICVHLAGWPCDMDPIMDLAERHGLKVVEDCAQAHGALYKGRPVGSIGHVGAWSFCQDKIMTTGGEGGMVTTQDEALWRMMWAYKDHGKSYQAVYDREHPAGFRWLHEGFGTNWRMIEVQAVIGRIQLQRMSEWNRVRNENCEKIWACARELQGVRVPTLSDDIRHAGYKCYIFVEPGRLKAGWTRRCILDTLNEAGVPCNQGSCSEIYLERAFDNTGWRPEKPLPVAHELGETSMMFMVHPTLTRAELEHTCTALRRVMTEASQ